jgi:hypothetical protein
MPDLFAAQVRRMPARIRWPGATNSTAAPLTLAPELKPNGSGAIEMIPYLLSAARHWFIVARHPGAVQKRHRVGRNREPNCQFATQIGGKRSAIDPQAGGNPVRILKQLCLALVAMSALTGAALAQSAAVTNYKQQVTRIVETWKSQMSHFNDEMAKAKSDLDALNKMDPHPADYDKRAAALKTTITNDQASLDYATRSAEVDLGTLEFKPANKDEGLPLPQFVKDIIAAKGLPLTNSVSVAPAATWNWKTNTLGTLTVKFNIKVKNL